MAFDIQVNGVPVGQFDDAIAAALKAAITPTTTPIEKAVMEHAVGLAKQTVGWVSVAGDSDVYCAIQGNAGMVTVESTGALQNWLNLAITESYRGTVATVSIDAPPISEGASPGTQVDLNSEDLTV